MKISPFNTILNDLEIHQGGYLLPGVSASHKKLQAQNKGQERTGQPRGFYQGRKKADQSRCEENGGGYFKIAPFWIVFKKYNSISPGMSIFAP